MYSSIYTLESDPQKDVVVKLQGRNPPPTFPPALLKKKENKILYILSIYYNIYIYIYTHSI